MKKTIKIFLASSITEFEKERNELEVFIRRISDLYEEMYDISLRPIRCEAIDPYITDSRTQDIINEALSDSELCIVLVYTRFGEFTYEEFKHALNLFRESNHKLPKIYVYFKKLDEGLSLDKSVLDFMNELDNNLHYYWSNFSSIDTVKLRIALSLTALNQNLKGIVLDNGKVSFEGNTINEINLDTVEEFHNHQELNELKKEYDKIDKKYYELLPKYKQDNATYFDEYTDLITQRKLTKEKIENIENSILELSQKLMIDSGKGEMSNRQKAAYKAFEEGRLHEALDILDEGEMELDYRARRQRIIEKQQKELQKNALMYINELHTKVEILKSLEKFTYSLEKIITLYQKMLEVVYEEGVAFYLYREYFDLIYDRFKDYAIPSFYEQMEKYQFNKYLEDAMSIYSEYTIDISKEDYHVFLLYKAIYLMEQNNSTQTSMFKSVSNELFSEVKTLLDQSINYLEIAIDNEKYEYSDKLFIAYNKLNYIANSIYNQEVVNELEIRKHNFYKNHLNNDNEIYFKALMYALTNYTYFGITKEDKFENIKLLLNKALLMVEKNPLKYTIDAVKCYEYIVRFMPDKKYLFEMTYEYNEVVTNKINKDYLLDIDNFNTKLKLYQNSVELIKKVIDKDQRTYTRLLANTYENLFRLYASIFDEVTSMHYYLLELETIEKLIDIYEDGEINKQILWQELIVKYKKLVLDETNSINSLPYYFGERGVYSNDGHLFKNKYSITKLSYINKIKEYRKQDIFSMLISMKSNFQNENQVLKNMVFGYVKDFIYNADEAIEFVNKTINQFYKDISNKNKEYYNLYIKNVISSYSFISSLYTFKFKDLYNQVLEISSLVKNEEITKYIENMKIDFLCSLVNKEDISVKELEELNDYSFDMNLIESSYERKEIYKKLLDIYIKEKNSSKLELLLDKYITEDKFIGEREKILIKMEAYANCDLLDNAHELFDELSEEELKNYLEYINSWCATIIINVAKKINKEEYINTLIDKVQ